MPVPRGSAQGGQISTGGEPRIVRAELGLGPQAPLLGLGAFLGSPTCCGLLAGTSLAQIGARHTCPRPTFSVRQGADLSHEGTS